MMVVTRVTGQRLPFPAKIVSDPHGPLGPGGSGNDLVARIDQILESRRQDP